MTSIAYMVVYSAVTHTCELFQIYCEQNELFTSAHVWSLLPPIRAVLLKSRSWNLM
jgi:hypothetical protein